MILAIHTHNHTHKYGADHYLLRDDEEVQRLRKEIAQEWGTRHWLTWSGDTWTGSPEQVNQYWQDRAKCAFEWFETTSLTYHYEKP